MKAQEGLTYLALHLCLAENNRPGITPTLVNCVTQRKTYINYGLTVESMSARSRHIRTSPIIGRHIGV